MSAQAGRGAGFHATAVVYGEHGVLILGASGSGKSALALALLSRARDTGQFGALVGDDRVYLHAAGGRLVASGAPHMAGVIERRTAGFLTVRCESAAVVRLIVELSGRDKSWPRLPEDLGGFTIEGISVARLALDSSRSGADLAVAVDERIEIMGAVNGDRLGISLEHCTAVHKNRKVASSPPA